jgi:TP901 family phage tail tape measure protein
MPDNSASFRVVLDGEAGTLDAFIAQFKSRFRSDVAELQATASKLDLFAKLTADLKTASDASLNTRQRVVELGQEIAKVQSTGGKVGDDLSKSLKAAETAAASASKEYNRQSDTVGKLRAQLSAAGVNVAQIATEQQRLATATRAAADAATEQAAKQALGLKTLSDVRPEIQRLNAAYNTLRSSGTLSVRELSVAQQQLTSKTAELRAQVTTLPAPVNATREALVSAFQTPLAHALALGGVIGTVTAAIAASSAAAREFRQNIAEIDTVTNLTKRELDDLGLGARALARELGIDVNQALRGLFDLIRSGVSPDNALEVLRVSAEAAKASVTDLGTGVKVANLLLDAFGASASDLPRLFDAIIAGAKGGGATLKEFAESAGPLLNVAKAANIPFNELLATLTVLVDKSGNAQQSIGDLTKIIARIDTAEARAKLRELGIEGDSLTEIFRKIGERGLGLDQILQLGVASTKSAASIAALTNNAGELPAALDKIEHSAGAASDAIRKLQDSPHERAARFNAELHDAAENIGEVVGSGSRLASVGTSILRQFNEIPAAFREASRAADDENKSVLDVVAAFLQVSPLAAEAARSMAEVKTEADDASKAAAANAATIKTNIALLADFGKRLLDDIKAIHDGSSREIADAQARADAQIAALDRSAAATAATAKATLGIQIRLNADRLAIIVKAEADINTAIDRASAARAEVQRRAGASEKQIAAEIAQARIAALAPVLAQYQAHYNALIAQSQAFAAKVESIERERLDFNRGIEQTLFEVRLSKLSVFDQYVAKVRESERLISEARKAGANGDLTLAKQFTEQAIQLAGQLAEVTDANGRRVVSGFEAQETKLGLVKKAAAAYNDVLSEQADAAKRGSEETQNDIDKVTLRIENLQTIYRQLKDTVAEGLQVRMSLDEQSVDNARATIEDLARPRTTTLTIEVQRVDKGGGEAPAPGFARGGPVGRIRSLIASTREPIQAFAGGGFARPTWSKVPGVGNADTVPASLKAGSFVVRKAASSMYGDALMSRLARGYAAGGTVSKEDVARFAASFFGFDPFGGADTAAPTPPTGKSPAVEAAKQTPISFDSRPIPEALITAANVVQYAREMLNMVGQGNPLLGSLLPAIQTGIAAVDRNPGDLNALKALLQAAETIGSNPFVFSMWGRTQSSGGTLTPTWFVDWLERRGVSTTGGSVSGGGGLPTTGRGAGLSVKIDASSFAKRFFGSAIPRVGNPLFALLHPTGLTRAARPFAEGGSSSDTVPAWLTPGEYVLQPKAASALGADLLHAVNSMRIAPSALRAMLDMPSVPSPRYFAEGGPVTAGASVGPVSGSSPGGQTAGTVINASFHFSDPFSEDNVRRRVVPVLKDLERRGR